MKTACVGALCLGLIAASPALAGIVRVDFSGSVDAVYVPYPLGSLASHISPSLVAGTPFSGYLTFDDAAPRAADGGDDYAIYAFAAPPWALNSTLAEYSIEAASSPGSSSDEFSIGITGGFFGGAGLAAFARALSGPGADGFDFLQIQLDLVSAHPEERFSTNLQDVPWNLSAYSTARVRFTFWEAGDSIDVDGPLTSLAVVPEPAAGVLAGVGFVALGTLGFRRARS